MITVNNIRDVVISTLNQSFSGIKIYGEEIKQGFREPCFFVSVLSVGHDRELNRRYKRDHSFDVHYFDVTNEALHAMAEQLYGSLEYIQSEGGTYRGKKMHHEIVDSVLHFFVDYAFHVMRVDPEEPKMQTLDQEVGFK